MRRSSDSCFAVWGDRTFICLPRVSPSDWLSPKGLIISTYSGGTVRDSHPVILFSFRGSSPRKPRNGLSSCRVHHSIPKIRCQGGFSRHFSLTKGIHHGIIYRKKCGPQMQVQSESPKCTCLAGHRQDFLFSRKENTADEGNHF